jgi:hypothetical protein
MLCNIVKYTTVEYCAMLYNVHAAHIHSWSEQPERSHNTCAVPAMSENATCVLLIETMSENATCVPLIETMSENATCVPLIETMSENATCVPLIETSNAQQTDADMCRSDGQCRSDRKPAPC